MSKIKVLDAISIDGGFMLTTGKEYEILNHYENEIEITHDMYGNIKRPFVIGKQDYTYVEFL